MYVFVIIANLAVLSQAINNGVGRTPAMGFNNWNSGLSSSAETALSAANHFVSLGLNKLGYEYVNIDDVWPLKTRSNGKLTPDPSKWPNGMKAVADQIHGMGLKMGLYGDSGQTTCAGYPGSAGYETTDAQTLASWGIDFWKYDNCATPSTGSSKPRYQTMQKALNATGRTIYYAMCSWGADSVWEWGNTTGNSWRVGGDDQNNWSSISTIAANFARINQYAAPGGFNDFDMLEVGNGGLSAAEERAHFGIWAMAKSPLLIGTDLSKIASSSLAILKNADIISINQDPLGIAATYFQPKGQAAFGSTLYPYWSGKLSTGYVVGLVAVNGATTLSVKMSDVPGLGAGPYAWKECYTGKTGNGTTLSATLASHDMAVFKITTVTPTVTPTKTPTKAPAMSTSSM